MSSVFEIRTEKFVNRIYANIRIEPKPAPRPRFSKIGHAYNPEWYDGYKRTIAKQVLEQFGGIYIDSEMAMDITVIKSVKATSSRYGDIDNIAKGVIDSLIGIAYPDDKLITTLLVRKRFSQDPNYCGISIAIYF